MPSVAFATHEPPPSMIPFDEEDQDALYKGLAEEQAKRGGMKEERPYKKPWFGPKRIGYGIRPQTWQGWLIILIFAIVVIVVARLVIH